MKQVLKNFETLNDQGAGPKKSKVLVYFHALFQNRGTNRGIVDLPTLIFRGARDRGRSGDLLFFRQALALPGRALWRYRAQDVTFLIKLIAVSGVLSNLIGESIGVSFGRPPRRAPGAQEAHFWHGIGGVVKIWTWGHFPLTMGGNVRRPVACDVSVAGPFDIGKGYQAYIGTSPSGKTFVAEGETGGIIGSTLDEVRADVASGDNAVMRKQIEDNRPIGERAEMLTPDHFWRLLRAN